MDSNNRSLTLNSSRAFRFLQVICGLLPLCFPGNQQSVIGLPFIYSNRKDCAAASRVMCLNLASIRRWLYARIY